MNMIKGFWDNIKKPIMALAPMHDVTDTVFRQMILEKGKPDVMFTEFVSTDGLVHEYSRDKMVKKYLRYTEKERPLVAQIWGTDPEKHETVAKMLVDMKFDGIDINFGCPEKSAVKHGACSAMIQTPGLAREIVRATMRGAGNIPVSVKTRIGWNENVIDSWMEALLETKPAVITVHGRTAKQMSRVPADWSVIGRAVEIAKGTGTLILGNGDVRSLDEAHEKVEKYGVDGVMFGRAIFSNHWLFDHNRVTPPTAEEKLEALIRHAQLYEKTYSNIRNFAALRKHFKAYTNGIKGGKQLRMALMEARTSEEVRRIVKVYLSDNL